MIRLGTFVWLAVLTLIGVGLYQVELGVLAKEAQFREINRRIEANRAAMHVLDAEWSYLNDPTRLTDLARRYTDLAPVTPTQIAGFDRLTPRLVDNPNFDRLAPNLPPPPTGAPLLMSAAPRSAPQTAPAASPGMANGVASSAPAASGSGAIMAASKTQTATQPTDEQAAADDVINAILSDMRKAQQQ